MKNKIFSPSGLYISWLIFCLIVGLISPIIDKVFGPSAQIGFIIMMYALIAMVCGTFLISIFNMLYFKIWFKKFWYINGLISFITGGLIIYYSIKIATL